MTSNNRNMAKPILWLAACLLLTSPAFSATDPVGQLFFALRGVEILRADGNTENGKKGASLFEGDQVTTGAKGRAQLKFNDGARVALKPDTVFRIDSYKKPEAATVNGLVAAAKPGSAALSMLKGGIRAVSGSITKGNPDGMSVKTPVATMGIRGTDFSALLTKSKSSAGNSTPEDQLLVGVRDGQVRITNDQGTVDIYKGEFGVASRKKSPKVSLDPPEGLVGSDESSSESSDEEDEAGADSEGNAEQTSEGEESSEQTDENSKEKSEGERKEETKERSDEDSSSESGEGDKSDGDGSGAQEGGTNQSNDEGSADQGGSTAEPTPPANEQQSPPPPPPATEDPTPENPPQTEDGTNLEDPDAVEDDITEPTGLRSTAFSASRENNNSTEPVPEIVIGQGISEGQQTSLAADGGAERFASDISGSANEEPSIFSIRGEDGQLTANTFDLGADPETGFTWGRWAEGSATVSPGPDGQDETATLSGQQSLHWLYGAVSEGDPLSDITASADYSLVGNTSPTDSQGNIGLLGVADLSANFSSRTVNLNVQLLINDQNWSASGEGTMASGGVLPFSGSLAGTATQDGSQVDTLSGSYNGAFSPNILDVDGVSIPAGAGLTYGLQGGTSEIVTGAAIVGSPSVQQRP